VTIGLHPQRRIAVLIDAENVGADAAAQAMEKALAYGSVTVRRAYRPWSDELRRRWEATLDEHAIAPVHVEGGKNNADVALTIDAMDLLHGGRIDGLCIVSSDGDFTRLAQRAREHGLIVIGIGANLSNWLRAACDDVVRIPTRENGSDAQVAESEKLERERFVQVVRTAIKKVGPDTQGWARVTEVQKHVGRDVYRGETRARTRPGSDGLDLPGHAPGGRCGGRRRRLR
jgi:uncharacterized protein (TIGR00288 family)